MGKMGDVLPSYVTWALGLFTVFVWFWDATGDPSAELLTVALLAFVIVLLDVLMRRRRRGSARRG
jgi:hypothetical protein